MLSSLHPRMSWSMILMPVAEDRPVSTSRCSTPSGVKVEAFVRLSNLSKAFVLGSGFGVAPRLFDV